MSLASQKLGKDPGDEMHSFFTISLGTLWNKYLARLFVVMFPVLLLTSARARVTIEMLYD